MVVPSFSARGWTQKHLTSSRISVIRTQWLGCRCVPESCYERCASNHSSLTSPNLPVLCYEFLLHNEKAGSVVWVKYTNSCFTWPKFPVPYSISCHSFCPYFVIPLHLLCALRASDYLPDCHEDVDKSSASPQHTSKFLTSKSKTLRLIFCIRYHQNSTPKSTAPTQSAYNGYQIAVLYSQVLGSALPHRTGSA